MRASKLRQLWRDGKAAVNAWLTIPSPWTAEVMAHTGFDSLTIDMQHGLADYQTAVAMLQAISSTEAVPLVRVPWNEPSAIMRLLDAGAYGVIAPMINTERDAEAFVGACRYPPGGFRSYGPTRAGLLEDDYLARAGRLVVTLAQIETRQAMERLEGILDVAGLDGVYVGAMDLSLSLGITDLGNLNSRELNHALDTILAATAKRGQVAGIHAQTPGSAAALANRGFRLVTPINDTHLLRSTAQAVLAQTRKELDGSAKE